ncbi:hypothetical protein [Acinetobacter lactucae]|uniref:hypothetical protein n=1 Tax=Acinetobacter lactucae TaxID=1785128 RepID=UPI0034D31E1A
MGFLFENKRQVWLLVILIILIWLVFPFLFKAFMSWMSWIGADLKTFADYGPVGDIYGSLNTLFTSATLIIVMYSAYLQREANKDIRQAMANQLQQAKQATDLQLEESKKALDVQLKQAKQAAADQIAHATKLHELQLAQAQQSSAEQLEFTKASYKGQIEESRYAIFSNMFYSLLNQKQECFKNLELIGKNGDSISSNQIFYFFSKKLFSLLLEEWKDLSLISEKDVSKAFSSYIMELNNGKAYTDIHSYFGYYVSLIELIRRSEIDDSHKEFFSELLSMSISATEQLTFLWFVSGMSKFKYKLRGSKIFDLNLDNLTMPFAEKFLDISYFAHPNMLRQLDENI